MRNGKAVRAASLALLLLLSFAAPSCSKAAPATKDRNKPGGLQKAAQAQRLGPIPRIKQACVSVGSVTAHSAQQSVAAVAASLAAACEAAAALASLPVQLMLQGPLAAAGLLFRAAAAAIKVVLPAVRGVLLASSTVVTAAFAAPVVAVCGVVLILSHPVCAALAATAIAAHHVQQELDALWYPRLAARRLLGPLLGSAAACQALTGAVSRALWLLLRRAAQLWQQREHVWQQAWQQASQWWEQRQQVWEQARRQARQLWEQLQRVWPRQAAQRQAAHLEAARQQEQQRQQAAAAAARPPAGGHCPICLDDITDDNYTVLRACGHFYCQREMCVRNLVRAALLDRSLPCCRHGGCRVTLDPRDVERVVAGVAETEGLAAAERLSARYAAASVQAAGCQRVECLSCPAELWLGPGEELGPRDLCSNCGQPPQAVPQAAGAGSSGRQQQQRDLQKSNSLIRRTSKQCPGCPALVERNGGCDHMTCTRCQAHFCWVCGQGFRPAEYRTHFVMRDTLRCPGAPIAAA